MMDIKKLIADAHKVADREILKHKIKAGFARFRKWAVEPCWISNGQFIVILLCLLGFVIY